MVRISKDGKYIEIPVTENYIYDISLAEMVSSKDISEISIPTLLIF